jgi:hypothetical protein
MKIMIGKTSLLCVALLCLACESSVAGGDVEELTSVLHEFLGAADEMEAHDRFWADDLIYTSSDGSRFGKADILAGFDGSEAEDESSEDGASMAYSGDEVDVRLYGDTAIVAFRLVGTPTDKSENSDVLYYFNTGTFRKRDGVWQVVAWQATKIPPQ